MSAPIPRPSSTTTGSSDSMASTASQQFTGSMDSYALSMYEHTRSLMAAAHIPYGSPASLLLATSPGSPGAPAVAGTSSGGVGNGLKPGNGSLPRMESS
ncbi:hypothetical protein CDEST_11685 [Colletotrichum destructivum]|uniref:Uncharacterized protein n=1 Tax=Colletotrichum destructivum TaxID=34406 RepID=A0AAX4ITT6_9PEZI|nr:hypothetical protein CDEST_11685 [Colletotrichum destructivum]